MNTTIQTPPTTQNDPLALKDPTSRTRSWIGKALFANGAELNQFETLAGFMDEAAKLDEAIEGPVFVGRYIQDGENRTAAFPEAAADFHEDYKAYRWARSGKPISVVSQAFSALQSREALLSVADVLRSYGIEPRGRITETAKGRLNAKLYFQNPEYEFAPNVRLADGKSDTIGLGVSLGNSYGNPMLAFTGETFAVRQICANFNLWGEWMGSTSVTHVGDIEAEVATVVEGMLSRVPFMQKRIEEAAVFHFEDDAQVTAALRGMGIGQSAVDTVLAQKSRLEPTWATGSPSAWQVYNALTAAATHSDLSETTRDRYLKLANKTLKVDDIGAAVERGLALLEAEKAKPAPNREVGLAAARAALAAKRASGVKQTLTPEQRAARAEVLARARAVLAQKRAAAGQS